MSVDFVLDFDAMRDATTDIDAQAQDTTLGDHNMVFIPGRLGGQAVQFGNGAAFGMYKYAPGFHRNPQIQSIPSTNELLLGGWIRRGPRAGAELQSSYWAPVFGIEPPSGDPVIVLWDAYMGRMRLCVTEDVSWAVHASWDDSRELDVSDWAQVGQLSNWTEFELYVNTSTKVCQLYIGGFLVCEKTFSTATFSGGTNWGYKITAWSYSPSTYYAMQYDDIYGTNGPRLDRTDNTVQSVTVGAMINGTGGGIHQGFLQIGGTLYRNTGVVTPAYYTWVADTFPKNPATSQPWTWESLQTVEGFGVCRSTAPASGPSFLMTDICLLALVYTAENGPEIRRYTGSTYFVSTPGGVTKSDNSRSYKSLLEDFPRQADNVDGWVTVTDGCLGATLENVIPTIIFGKVGLTFAEAFDTEFVEWDTIFGGNGINFDSYFVSGYKIHGEGDKKFQSNYVTVNYEAHEDDQAYFQGVWDYALSPETGRYSTKQLVVIYQPNYRHLMRKLKVRGHGRVLQFKISSLPGKDFHINGWTVLVTANSTT